MEKVERTLQLDRDAADLLLRLAGSKRRQGEYVSGLIRAAGSGEIQPVPTSQLDELEAQLRELAAEIAQLRAQQQGSTP